MTVGQLVAQMLANEWDQVRAAAEFGLTTEAVIEALDYAERFGALIAEEAAEEVRRAEQRITHHSPGSTNAAAPH